MERKLITCPETGYFEVIEVERTALGSLIASCSRFERCHVECSRLCGARFDHRTDPSVDPDTGALVCIVPYELDHGFDDDTCP